MSNLNKRIMRRVYALYLWYTLTCPLALKIYVTAFFAVLLSASVSISHVFANMPALTNFAQWYQFNIAAFNHTELSVKFLFVSLFLLVVWLLRDLIRTSMRVLVSSATPVTGEKGYR